MFSKTFNDDSVEAVIFIGKCLFIHSVTVFFHPLYIVDDYFYVF